MGIGRTVACPHRWSDSQPVTVYDDTDESSLNPPMTPPRIVRVGSGRQCLDCGVWEYITVPADSEWVTRFANMAAPTPAAVDAGIPLFTVPWVRTPQGPGD